MDSPLVEHALDLLHGMGGVSARKMFGGYGLYRQGLMFALVYEEVLYLKADDVNRGDFAAAGTAPFTYEHTSGKTVEMPYWEAPSDLFDDPEAMVGWARRAFEAALRAKRPKAAPPTPGSRRKATGRRIKKI